MANLYDQATQRQKWDQTIDQVQKMGYPQNPAQPPAFAPPPPRQPQSFGTASAATTDQVSPPAAQNAGGMSYGEQMHNVGSALVSLPMEALKTVVSAPGYGLNKPSAAPAPAGMATPTAGAGRGAINPAPVNPAQPVAAAPAPTNAPTNEVMPGVYRHGRGQYSDNAAGMGMPANFTGQPSAQNMAAADALAGRQIPAGTQTAGVQAPGGMVTPVVPNSTNDWAARNNLRNLAVSASSITANGGRFDQSGRGDSPEVSAYKAAVATDQALQQAQPGLAAAAMRENAGLQREGMQQQGANTRSLGQIALEQQKVNQAAVTQGIDNRGKTMVQALQSQIATEPDGAKRQGIAQRLREMQGQSTADPYLVVPGGQQVDQASGKVYTTPSSVLNRQTQQFMQPPVQGGGALPPGMTKQVGTSGGKPVYEDANGKRFLAG